MSIITSDKPPFMTRADWNESKARDRVTASAKPEADAPQDVAEGAGVPAETAEALSQGNVSAGDGDKPTDNGEVWD